jgi:hypothetical protein
MTDILVTPRMVQAAIDLLDHIEHHSEGGIAELTWADLVAATYKIMEQQRRHDLLFPPLVEPDMLGTIPAGSA